MFVLAAAQPPSSSLAQAQPGLWEISGVPGAAAPVRQCLADPALLARFEHRAKSCSASTVREAGTSPAIDYHCGAAGLRHSEAHPLTPRSLRVPTHGLSDGPP